MDHRRLRRHVRSGYWTLWMVAGLALASPNALGAGESEPVDFVRDIRPILAKHCYVCHGPEKQESGFRLDVKQRAFAGGDLGEPAIVPGNSAASPLVTYVTGEGDLLMPPEGESLRAEQVALLRRWVDQGAPWPAAADPVEVAVSRHWSFQPLGRPEVPPRVAGEVRNPIDAFVLARLEQEGLSPAPAADRQTLVRRLYLDVLGLPPPPEVVQDFIDDADPQAYEKLVDRLLRSPHFGERWGRHWLDVVRFAESDGFETNQPRPNAWPYRDYVIRAFNEDKPYDRFIVEQLAGDAFGLDEATGFIVGGPWDRVKSPDPVLTAQQRADELHDMVSTTGSAFLGLTVGCARCHSHKFDPIPQKDYYALKACFAGVQHGERPLRSADDERRKEELQRLLAQRDEAARRLAEFQPLARLGRILLLDDDLAAMPNSAGPAAEELATPQGVAAHASGTERGQLKDAGSLARLPNLGGGYRWWQGVIDRDVFAWSPRVAGRFRVWLSWGCGWDTHTLAARYRLDHDGDLSTTSDQVELAQVDQRKFADGTGDLPQQPLWSGFLAAGDFDFTSSTRVVLHSDETGRPITADVLLLEEVAGTNAASGTAVPAQPALRDPVSRGENIDRFPPVTARFVRFTVLDTSQLEPCIDELEVFSAEPEARNVALASQGARPTASSTLPGYAIHKLEHVNDGLYGNDRSWISNERGAGWVQLELPRPERIERVVWSRDRDKVPRYEDRTATRYEIAVSLEGRDWQIVASSADRLPFSYRSRVPAIRTRAGLPPEQQKEFEQWEQRRTELEAEIQRLSSVPQVYAGKFVKPEETFRLHRGDPTQPREVMAPGTLSEFGGPVQLPLDASDLERRQTLAAWIASRENPLTPRVIVNRIWHYHFGQGLVATPSDFGVNGGRPSHPELLDWLAAELMDPQWDDAVLPADAPPAAVVSDGRPIPGAPASLQQKRPPAWSLKHVHRLILCSATYRQSSRLDPRGLKADADARLLWRYPPRRMEAEVLRDTMLALSGKLDLKAGGPGFDLFEPNTNYVKVYNSKQEFGPETFRRMVYQNKPRMQLDTTFGPFDCPDAGQIAPKRHSSTTPLQALSLLNSPFAIEQADFFAGRLQQECGPDIAAQVRRAFWLAFGREPAEPELSGALTLAREHGLPALTRALYNANELIMVY